MHETGRTTTAVPPTAYASPLAALGWDAAWQDALDVHRAGHLAGRVVRAGRGVCDVVTAARTGALTTRTAPWAPVVARAASDDPSATPVTGDWVVLAPAPGDDGAVPHVVTVGAVLPRRTAVVRPQVAAGSTRVQVLAANADVAVVVEPLQPRPDLGRVERLLALAWASGALPVVVLTKADLVPDADVRAAAVTGAAPGTEVLAVAALDGTGLDPLRGRLATGATLVLLGVSGAGKSTLLNALLGADVMPTRGLRTDDKGRHTTVTRELHPAPGGGAVLDTPGLRTVGLTGPEALDEVFADVEDLAHGCRFTDCAHVAEPGCAVQAAITAGRLTTRRLESYRALLREAERQAARTDARLRAERAGRDRARERARRTSRSRP